MTLFQAEQLLKSASLKNLSRKERIDKSIALAAFLLEATLEEKTHKEKKSERELSRMMDDPKGRLFLTSMTDQCFRTHSCARTADQLLFLLKKYGTPHFLSTFDKIKFWLFSKLGAYFQDIFIPLIRNQLFKKMSSVLLPEDPKQKEALFSAYKKENIRINLNHIGEAILGEEEASRRLDIYLQDLEDPKIEYISVKISTILSQINAVAFKETIATLAERLRLLYRKADSQPTKKFVNLDMEEYRDVDLTTALFQKVLNEEEFTQTHAGIVLQSYLPNAFALQQKLTLWAIERCRKGGAPIKIRIVKGANLAMEAVESSKRGWEMAPFDTKDQTDANFKRMLEYGLKKEHTSSVHIGVASHNLFDIAYAFILRAENASEEYVSFEMLEGMAAPMQRAVKKLAKGILLYCPEAKRKNFHNAVAYLIRRLDENGSPENFLRHAFSMVVGNAAWNEQKERFVSSFELIDTLPSNERRTQNRFLPQPPTERTAPFRNEPDTDFSLQNNRQWVDAIFLTAEIQKHPPIPLVVGGEVIHTLTLNGIDPSRPKKTLYSYSLADLPLIERALDCATAHEKNWSQTSFNHRSALLAETAQLLGKKRSEMIGIMIADGAKTIWEADLEYSEAIDFIEYYRMNWADELQRNDVKWSAKGTVLVASPWNFPCSIPVGGIAAALTAGNCVLFKPAPEAVLVGWHLVSAFWEAGVPKEVLQFINCKDEPVGSYLIKQERVSSVILTGATQTARLFLKLRPGIDLHAESGGKNAIIVTAMSDRDLAVRDIISSAFGHSGQKCSACSLVILEKEVYHDPHFKNQLADAALSLKVSSAWDKSAMITPLIRPPEGALYRGLTELEEGESWLLKPQPHPENPHLWSPGIKWGVRENSFTHQTELFGPLLGVMEAEDLEHAIKLANGTPYGLTSGLHSLDEREHALWRAKIVAGNLYINRTITGAIVARQPFGGTKQSSFGSGAKAGGPNYVRQFAKICNVECLAHEKAPLPSSLLPLLRVLASFNLQEAEQKIWKQSAENYAYWAPLLKKPTDSNKLIGQDNYFYHVPQKRVWLRVEKPMSPLGLLQVIAACFICQSPLEISSADPLPLLQMEGVVIVIEEIEALLQRQPYRIRLVEPATNGLKNKAAQGGIMLQDAPVLQSGRLELPHYLREISLSVETHRYGYLASSP